MSPPSLKTRARLSEVRYEIRGELARRARELEGQGRTLIKLHIGNPGAFGFRAPEHLQRAISDHIARTDPYTHQQGLPEAREAIAAFHRARGTPNASPERVFVGNGVSELIDISLRALLDPGDEVLLPSPDYPLWSAATILNDGRPVYYRCAPEDGFLPDPDQIESLVSSRTRAIVLINPNNPTGANYPRALLERIVAIAQKHGLLLMSDEIYDGILYDGQAFEPLAPLAGDHPCLSFGGLSKVHRACGWRVGWAMLSGDPLASGDFHHAMDLLGALRLCANVPGQFAIEQALHGADTISALCQPGGRLYETRRALIDACAASEHLSLVAPQGALYGFPGVVGDAAHGFDDHAFALEMLETQDVLIVPGSSFNVPYRTHFRVTLLPEADQLREVFARIDRVLARRAQRMRRTPGPMRSRPWPERLLAAAWALLLAACAVTAPAAPDAGEHAAGVSYLALGDSYTIGEGVAEPGRWPPQLAAALRAEGIALRDPRIIATTGWTTDELSAAIDAAAPASDYGFVTLLIGVNNQYRGRDVVQYRDEFRALLERAIGFAAGRADRVMVLSIPDWGATAFGRASGRDLAQVSRELDAYNAAARAECERRGVAFVDITTDSRAHPGDPAMLAEDGLHPSAPMYALWTRRALPVARGLLQ